MDDVQTLDALVRRFMTVEDITLGSTQQGFISRYRGRLSSDDSAAAYDQLAELLKPHHITPLFRWDENRHAIYLIQGPPPLPPTKTWVNWVLLALTLISLFISGATYGMDQPLPENPLDITWELLARGIPFMLSLFAILGAHEFGHYFMGRHYGVQVTLPYFIPFPLSPFGTLGAFINMRSTPKNRRELLDIGLAGPICGLLVAIPVLIVGLSQSHLNTIPLQPSVDGYLALEGNSLLYLGLKFLAFGQLLPAPITYDGLPPLLYWLRYIFTGTPAPLGALDVMLSPMAWAGWAGLLMTSLNLVPAGQLDGGHALYVLLGRKGAQRLWPVILGALILLGFFWNGWWLWAVLIFLLGRSFAEPLDQITPLDTRRRILAVVMVIVFFLVFTPIPLAILM